MISSRAGFVLCLAAAALALSACSKADKPASAITANVAPFSKRLKPIEFAGIDLRTVQRQQLEEVFYRDLKVPLVPRNEFQSIAEASGIFPEAETVEVAITRSGKLATMQFVFPGKNDPQLATRVTQLMEAKYGKPSAIIGKASQGEYRALWQMDGNFIIQVARDWPNTSTYLSYISGDNLTQLRDDYQNRLHSSTNLTTPPQ